MNKTLSNFPSYCLLEMDIMQLFPIILFIYFELYIIYFFNMWIFGGISQLFPADHFVENFRIHVAIVLLYDVELFNEKFYLHTLSSNSLVVRLLNYFMRGKKKQRGYYQPSTHIGLIRMDCNKSSQYFDDDIVLLYYLTKFMLWLVAMIWGRPSVVKGQESITVCWCRYWTAQAR